MKIIDRLRKLIRHEESARTIGNAAEAEAFAAKIQGLLDAYNLSLSDIDLNAAQSSIDRSSGDEFALHQWQILFIQSLAQINGCQVIFKNRSEITLVGNEDDRMIVFELYRYFEKLARDLADQNWNTWKLTVDYRRKRKKQFHSKLYKKSFLHGFVNPIVRRFRELHERAKAASNNQQALIFIGNKLAEANRWVENNLQTKSIQSKKFQWSKLKTDAYNEGYKSGNSVALTTKTME